MQEKNKKYWRCKQNVKKKPIGGVIKKHKKLELMGKNKKKL